MSNEIGETWGETLTEQDLTDPFRDRKVKGTMEELEGQFGLNKLGWYTPALVEENSWLNDKQKPEDLTKYGKNYAVVFEGDAATYLWTAKTAPEVGKKYWGHLQATSGKSIRFKTDKPEASMVSAPGHKNEPEVSNVAHTSHYDDKEDSIARAVALKASVEYLGRRNLDDDVIDLAEVFLSWLKHESSGTQQATVPTTTPETSNAVPSTPAATTGYQKFQEARNKVKQDPELQSLIDYADEYNGGEDDHTS